MQESFEMSASAELSPCGAYRYSLARKWHDDLPELAFIMLNPSTADAREDDPTIRRCIGFGRSLGFGSIVVGNLFALRSTDPKALMSHPDPVGPRNDQALKEIARHASEVICAWGANGNLLGRAIEVERLLRKSGIRPMALKLTNGGDPAHPLYLARDCKPFTYGIYAPPLPHTPECGEER